MGDVVHAVPVVADIKSRFPEAQIDWLVESSFADIPKNIVGISRVVESSVRAWKKQVLSAEVRQDVLKLKRTLSSVGYDYVIDLQGLLKSAILASLTEVPVSGYDWNSIREPIASLLYKRRFSVSRSLSAVERCRFLCADCLGYERPVSSPKFHFCFKKSEGVSRILFLFCNTSRESKLWPEDYWIQLCNRLVKQGFDLVLPWGSEVEHRRVLRIKEGAIPSVEVPERQSIGELMEKISKARAVIGLDTGMTHLSSAMGIPTVGIFRDYPIELVPLMGEGEKMALGGVDCCPSVEEVLAAFEEVIL